MASRNESFPRLYFITNRRLVGEKRLFEVIAQARDGGLRMVQLRERDLDTDALLRLGERIRAAFPPEAGLLIVNRNLDVARRIGADGVHTGGDPEEARRIRKDAGASLTVGYSAHRTEELHLAARAGADYASLSPVYPTISKGNYGPPLGLDGLRDACKGAPIPVFALGGMRRSVVREVIAAGAYGLAMMGGLLLEPSPTEETAAILRAMSSD